MPTLNWIGKDAVIRHHKEVPFRLLEADAALSHGGDTGNLIVQGDNLHALKALLPKYAGKVKCIYIDPPYNTGNEGWVYNDKVNSPEINRWLGSVVGKEAEDLSRHDKWLCMMYPRMVLLKQFLSEDGAIFVSIDDNEVASLILLMDEIFGRNCFVVDAIWRSADSSNNDAKKFSLDHNHTVVYSRSPDWEAVKLARSEENNAHYQNPDNDPRGPWFAGNVSSPNPRDNLRYELISPEGRILKPPSNGWRWGKERMQEMIESGEVLFRDSPTGILKKTYLSNQGGISPSSLWANIEETGHNRNAKYELKKLFPETPTSELFATPKPTIFIQRILQIATDKDSIILDSFAGSGTTGHAVLKQNAEDGGTRKFILVEMEGKIARDITAERVRRVAGGYTNAKGEAVAGLGGGFQFCTLSEEPLFNEFGDIRDDVRFAQLADFVWFAETGEGYMEKGIASPLHKPGEVGSRSSAKGTESPSPYSPLLGVKGGTAVYLLFNGILGDRRPQGGNILTQAVLDSLPPHEGPKVIYAAATRLGPAALQRAGIVFKQTPYAIEV